MSLARTIFVPLFLMCNIQRPGSAPELNPPVINSNFMFFLIMLLFGFSNGYLSSMCMMGAPSLQHNPQLRTFAHKNEGRVQSTEENGAGSDDVHVILNLSIQGSMNNVLILIFLIHRMMT